MRFGTRACLACAAVPVALTAALLVWVETGYESRLLGLQAEELIRTARLLSSATAGMPFDDPLADRLGRQTGLRVTLMDPDGTVLGDSDVPSERLAAVENHARRPEVGEARRGGSGWAHRASATVGRHLLYAAVRDSRGTFRVSRDPLAVEAAVARARRAILGAGVVGLLLAGALSTWLSRDQRRRVERVRSAVRGLRQPGEVSRAPVEETRDPLGGLRKEVHEVASALEARIGTLESERRDLEALFRSLSDGLAVVDDDGLVQKANTAFRAWAGRAEVEGTRFATLFRAPSLVDAVRRAMEEERHDTQEVELGERTVLASVQPYHGGALVVLRDLTRLRKLEGVRRDFVANVSHELKTPLTSLVGFAEAIAEGQLPAEQKAEFARRILANAMRMRRLVDDLLDLSLVESGSWHPRVETLDVAALARSVWKQVETQASERGVALVVDADPGARAYADSEATRQVLRNLIDNALRYAPEGSEIRVSVEDRGLFTRVGVSDRGPGIPSAHRERVFERFYRVDPARSRQAGGTGLGLSIVKHLILAHGGEVGIESEVGDGTEVWFTLPAAEEALEVGGAGGGSKRRAVPEGGPAGFISPEQAGPWRAAP